MGLEFSAEQEQVASLFTAYRNEIDIYTEDEEKDKAFYRKLFSRLLNGSIQISDVYPLGSSQDVIDACQRDNDTSRKKIYIVDGDIFIMFSPKPSMRNLFVLDSYCMENMVIDENAICTTLCNRIGTMEFDDLKRAYNYRGLVNSHKDTLIELFYYKAIDQKYRGFFTLHSMGYYYDNNNNLDLNKIQIEKDTIRTNLISTGFLSEDDFDQELALLRQKFPLTYDTFHRIISGKDFLIHMINCHAKKSLNINTGYNPNVWKYNLAQHCSLNRLATLKAAIIAASS